MKRSPRPSTPNPTELPRRIAQRALPTVRGGVSAVEYALLVSPAPNDSPVRS